MSYVRRTIVYYSEWATRCGRFQRIDNGFELWIGREDIISPLLGAVGRKRVLDDSIVAIFTACELVRIVFDGDDELMLRREVLADFPQAVLDRVGARAEVPPASAGLKSSAQCYIDEMRARQRALGPVSFKYGRGERRAKSSRYVRAGKAGMLAAIVALLLRAKF